MRLGIRGIDLGFGQLSRYYMTAHALYCHKPVCVDQPALTQTQTQNAHTHARTHTHTPDSSHPVPLCPSLFRPDLVDLRKVRAQTARENLDLAFNVAEREFGVTRLLDPEGESRARLSVQDFGF